MSQVSELAEVSDELSTVRISKNMIGETPLDVQNVTHCLGVLERQVKASLWANTGMWWIRFNAPDAAAQCIDVGNQGGYPFTLADKNLDMNAPDVIGAKKPTLFLGRLGVEDNCAFISTQLSFLPGGSFDVQLHPAKMEGGRWKDAFCFVVFSDAQILNAAPLPIRIHIYNLFNSHLFLKLIQLIFVY